MNDDEYGNWCQEQRQRVIEYLAKQNLDHLGVAEGPAFDVAPYFAIWAIQSKAAPGKVGWWAFSGDIPTDYVSADAQDCHPRRALRDLLVTWNDYIVARKEERNAPGVRVGNDNPKYAKLLESRVELLTQWLEDDDNWQYEGS